MQSITNQELSKRCLSLKLYYDSLKEAIKLAKLHNANENSITSLTKVKASVQEDYTKCITEVSKLMPATTNVVQISENWFMVRYKHSKNSTSTKLCVVKPEDLYMIERDTKRRSDLSESELDTLLAGIQDEISIEIYKQQVLSKAYILVLDYCSINLKDSDNEQFASIKVSAHASKRWIQRKLGIINEAQAEEYRCVHSEEVEKQVLEGYAHAELLWTDEDGIEYWFDKDNMVYIKGNNTIITVYEEDFGFGKKINRNIVFQQIEVIHEVKDALDKAESEYNSVIEQLDRDIRHISGQIRVLASQINLLESKKQSLLDAKAERFKELDMRRVRYHAEVNKLFNK